ncbi:CAP domain-containing protein [Cupriavidus sp. TMH.W2]|uniref:CAP domain-containing protein n=1 Tax=Cupriavidus sp. TMH.W2 TaxID=3434465 RepID=UPI003D78A967
MKKKSFYLAALAATVVWCGAAAGSVTVTVIDAPSPSQTPSAPAGLTPRMSVAEPTYAVGSGQLALFKAINALRQHLGVGLLTQDSRLDTAAQAHAVYLSSNNVSQHDEAAENPDFYGVSPLLRARKAGAPAVQWVGEAVAAARGGDDGDIGQRCFRQWYHTVYHLQSLVGNQESVGVGYSQRGSLGLNLCVLNFGTLTAAQADPVPNGVPYVGGQHFDAGTFVTVPRSGETDVQPGFNAESESPDPAPDLTAPGRPLMVYANGALAEILSVGAFNVIGPNGADVPARALVSPAAKAAGSAGAADPYIRNNAAFLLPLAPLAAGVTYTATFAGTRAGKPVSFTWSFTTSAGVTIAQR